MNATAVLDRRNSVFDPSSRLVSVDQRPVGTPRARLGFRLPADPDSRVVLPANRPARAGVERPVGTARTAWRRSTAHRVRSVLQGRRHPDGARLQAGRAVALRSVGYPARRHTPRRVQRGDPVSDLPDREGRCVRRRGQHLCRDASRCPISRLASGSACASRRRWRRSASTSATPCRGARVPGARGGISPSVRCSDARNLVTRSPRHTDVMDACETYIALRSFSASQPRMIR